MGNLGFALIEEKKYSEVEQVLREAHKQAISPTILDAVMVMYSDGRGPETLGGASFSCLLASIA